jgi:polyhydroxyalkanoate synthesis regulator protein
MFEQAMSMFSPFGTPGKMPVKPDESAKAEGGKSAKTEEIDELKAQMASMQAKLEKIARDGS